MAYQEANKGYDAYEKNREKLNGSLQAILDGQAKKNIELVDNNEFLKWITSDWDQTWEAKNNPEAQEPELDYQMRETFLSAPNGNKVQKLRTIEQISDAMWIVHVFRQQYGLENGNNWGNYGCWYSPYEYICDGEVVFDFDFYECSQNTKDLGNIYYEYARQDFDLNYRIETQYPFLDRVVEWIDTQ